MISSVRSADHILLIGFGGPEGPEDLDSFLAEVTRGMAIPPARIAEVKHHYEAVGGRSPYNEYMFRLADRLIARLRSHGVWLPVFLGMRNWHPYLRHVTQEIKREGFNQGIGLILAPHRSDSSFDKYIRNVEEAKVFANAAGLTYEYLPAWFNHPGFVAAQAAQIQPLVADLTAAERESTVLVFCAHSIPASMAQRCQYAEEFECTSRLVAQELCWENWQMAYQSRSGRPSDPWLEPSVERVLEELAQSGTKNVILVPVGFLCDNVEVLFDLDVEAKAAADKLGIAFARASTVMDHPLFVDMLAEEIEGMIQLPRRLPLTQAIVEQTRGLAPITAV